VFYQAFVISFYLTFFMHCGVDRSGVPKFHMEIKDLLFL